MDPRGMEWIAYAILFDAQYLMALAGTKKLFW